MLRDWDWSRDRCWRSVVRVGVRTCGENKKHSASEVPGARTKYLRLMIRTSARTSFSRFSDTVPAARNFLMLFPVAAEHPRGFSHSLLSIAGSAGTNTAGSTDSERASGGRDTSFSKSLSAIRNRTFRDRRRRCFVAISRLHSEHSCATRAAPPGAFLVRAAKFCQRLVTEGVRGAYHFLLMRAPGRRRSE